MEQKNKIDLNLIDYILGNDKKSEEIMIVHTLSKDLLNTCKSLTVNTNQELGIKYNPELGERYIDIDYISKKSFLSLSIKDEYDDSSLENTDKFQNFLEEKGMGMQIVLDKPREEFSIAMKYRIYDTLVFVKCDYQSAEEGYIFGNKDISEEIDESLTKYCLDTRNPIGLFDVYFKDNRFFYQISQYNAAYTQNGEKPNYQDNNKILPHLMDNLNRYCEFLKTDYGKDTSAKELRLKLIDLFNNLSFKEKNLLNFWINYIFDKLFIKYPDITLIVFHFGERLHSINIEGDF